jgi:hypothetical protein
MADNMDLREEDRLPWLETVAADEPEGPSLGRVLVAVVLGLAVLSLIVFGLYKLQSRPAPGDGELIAAQEGDYKVKPDEPGGMKVEGEGTSAVATSAGKGAGNGAIDLNAVPEKPIAGKHVAAPPRETASSATPRAGRSAAAPVPQSGGRLVAAAPIASAKPVGQATASGGSLVQLGAYPSEAAANTAWTRYSKRFGYIAALGKSVQPVAAGGRTMYRLRVSAGSANQAGDICGRLRVAGESCFVAS